MAEIVARCGYRCDLCIIFKGNLKGPEDRARFRDGLLKYYRHRIALEECYCEGCLTPDSERPVLVTADCPVRACAMAKGLDNCAGCAGYPCRNLKRRFIDRRKVRARFGAPIPEEDYRDLIMPYESQRVLDRIRKSAGPGRKVRTRP
jgi:hypothetical protein